MEMEDTVTRNGVATATDGPLRPAVYAADIRLRTVRAAEGLVLSKVEALALHVLPSRILPQIEPISGRKHAELNRQIRGVEHLVTYRKQTATTCSNRQKIQKWTSTFLPEIAQARTLSFSLRTEQAILPEGGYL